MRHKHAFHRDRFDPSHGLLEKPVFDAGLEATSSKLTTNWQNSHPPNNFAIAQELVYGMCCPTRESFERMIKGFFWWLVRRPTIPGLMSIRATDGPGWIPGTLISQTLPTHKMSSNIMCNVYVPATDIFCTQAFVRHF